MKKNLPAFYAFLSYVYFYWNYFLWSWKQMCFILKTDFDICDCFIGPNLLQESRMGWASFV